MTIPQEDAIFALQQSFKSYGHYINIRVYGLACIELQTMQGTHIDGRRVFHHCRIHQTLPEIADIATFCLERGIRYSIEGKEAIDYVTQQKLIQRHNI